MTVYVALGFADNLTYVQVFSTLALAKQETKQWCCKFVTIEKHTVDKKELKIEDAFFLGEYS